MEEGKLCAILRGVQEAEKEAERAEDGGAEDICVKNGLNYIHMEKGAGHWEYGACYFTAQVGFGEGICNEALD